MILRQIGILGLRIPSNLDDVYHFSAQIPDAERPVVFIGPHEHHSNELPWRESRRCSTTCSGSTPAEAAAARDRTAPPAQDRPGDHLGFGHGIHGCVGQQLARLELTEGFSLVLERPGLRLVLADQLDPQRLAHDVATYAAGRMVVAWG